MLVYVRIFVFVAISLVSCMWPCLRCSCVCCCVGVYLKCVHTSAVNGVAVTCWYWSINSSLRSVFERGCLKTNWASIARRTHWHALVLFPCYNLVSHWKWNNNLFIFNSQLMNTTKSDEREKEMRIVSSMWSSCTPSGYQIGWLHLYRCGLMIHYCETTSNRKSAKQIEN